MLGRLLLLWAVLTLPPLASQAQPAPDLSALDAILERAAFTMRSDLELVVLHRGEVVYRKLTSGHGGMGATGEGGRLPIASASKWLAAATVQSMVDEGLLAWDDPAGLHLYYLREDKAPITLRQIFSHTSGMRAGFPCLAERTKTIDNCVQEIARSPLLYAPGTTFHYGDAGMQVGGRVAETVTGRFWEDLFQQRIAQPLGMRSTTFQPDGPALNPDIAAGAASTADDYLRFVQMLAAGGEWGGKRILSRRGVERMLADQTGGARIASSYYAADEAIRTGAGSNRYGFGNWLEGAGDGVSEANSSQGAFGVSPYISRDREFAFLVFQRNAGSGFQRFYYEIQDALNRVFPMPKVARTAKFVEREVPVSQTSVAVAGGAAQVQEAWTAHRYVPAACKEETAQCPALIALHADGSNALAFAGGAGLAEFAERERAVVEVWDGAPAEPGEDGEGAPRAWRLAPDFGAASRNDAQIPIVASLDLAATPGVDARRIYLLGFREGADVAALAACRAPDAFAGVVLVQPSMMLKNAGNDETARRVCGDTGRLAVMLWGSAPEETDGEAPAPSASSAQAAFWASRQRCTAHADSAWIRGSSRWQVTDWSGCDSGAQVRLLTLPKAVETWPGDGTAVSWEFLRGLDRGFRKQGAVVQTNAASYVRRHASPGALASLFGEGLAPATAFAEGPGLPTTLGGVRVEVRDRAGTTRNAAMIFVSPGQINLQIPEGLQTGTASVFVYQGQQLTHRDWLYIDDSAPGLFAAGASGEGPPAGEVLHVRANGERVTRALARGSPPASSERPYEPEPILLGEPGTEVYLILYGTGWRESAAMPVRVVLGEETLEPEYAGKQGSFAGLDQVNVRLDTLSAEAMERITGRVNPVAVCTAAGCSERLELRIEAAGAAAP
ncbi:MAG: serine hydrolase [Bryobacterales bacterium]|nr:serine hydrolase [Bryobacterales bacterium]